MEKSDKKKKIYVSMVAGVVATMLGVLGNAGSVSAWGPERTTYTNDNPAPSAVFNSITDNAAVGDERNFVRVVEVHDDGTKDAYSDEVRVHGGGTYEVYIYYHNNASTTYNTKDYEYRGIARETKVSAEFPETIKAGERGEVNAVITSTTTAVPAVWDEAYLLAEEDVYLAYITGSAKIYNDWKVNGKVLSTNLFSEEGTYIGLNELNGIILGCDEYSGQVVFRVKATKIEHAEPETPVSAFEIEKKVRKGEGAWESKVEVEPGEEIEFKVTYRNLGTVAQKDVSVYDTLESAKGMEYVLGSTRVIWNGGEATEGADGIFTGGFSIGEVKAGEEVSVSYKVKIREAETFECGKTVMNNLAGVSGRRADQENAGVATMHDSVEIDVSRTGGTCLPSTLPETGPAQIILAVVVVLGIGGGVAYYLNSRKQVKDLEKQAKDGEKKEMLGGVKPSEQEKTEEEKEAEEVKEGKEEEVGEKEKGEKNETTGGEQGLKEKENYDKIWGDINDKE